MNKLIIVEDSPFEEDLSSDSEISSDDKITMADSKLDNESENTLKKLLSKSHVDIDSPSTEPEIESDFDNKIELLKLILFIEKKLQDEILLPKQKWRLGAVL
ncbi:8767_t:CDS:2 [Funneliformis caledonium]|uniref:8767_t:CDS:1 n=1 Tax=Funneliformis caledonium TaxID=1117310 RepID=A0A9N9HT44_9GLOM|nr:8767_t:CDS:2 [Funneliformis caledonium]